jgi:molybdate transport system ATP-binding protein
MSEIFIEQRLQRDGFLLDAKFVVPAQGITGILGRSGSGKTSLLRAIAGLEPTAEGRVQVGDGCWQDAAQSRPPHQRPVGFVFQQPGLFPHLSVFQNLRFGQRYRPATKRAFALDDAIQLLGLSALLERKPASLSGGEQQRVAIARALASSPELLLFDEPLSALDEERKAELLPYLERMHRELRVPGLYVSHSLTEVTRIADQLLLLDSGTVVDCGPTERVLTAPAATAGFVGGAQALVVVDAQIVCVQAEQLLTHARCAGGELLLPETGLIDGAQVRLQILARDVSIALSRSADSSILNILPVTVDAITDVVGGQVMVRLLYGSMPLLSYISKASLCRLNLKAGDEVFAQLKAVAVLA